MSDTPPEPPSRPAPGWYPDPSSPAMERWWDGEEWSDRTRPSGGTTGPGFGGTGGWGSGSGAPAGSPPPNYLVQAILTTLFCCLPFGIVSIVKSSQVNSKWAAGDLEGARQASADARKWAWVAFGVGLAVILISLASGGF